jgi:hypothetical protein
MSGAFDDIDDDLESELDFPTNTTRGNAATESSAQASSAPSVDDCRESSSLSLPPDALDPSGDSLPDSFYEQDAYIAPVWVRNPEIVITSQWPDPRDLASKLYEGAPFNINWFPACIGDFVGDIAERMGGDAGAPAMGAIAACCGLADDGFYTTPKLQDTGWRERAGVWTLAIGPSASKKTWLLEAAIKPINSMDGAITKAYLEKLDQWNYEMEGYADRRKAASKAGEPKPEAPEKPAHEHLMMNEFTIESIREALIDSPRGILLYRDELAGLLRDLDRYSSKGSGDRYSLMELDNGGPKKIGRVGNFKTVPNWSATITGCLTPAAIKSFASDLNEDGLLQRYTICMVKPAGDDVDRPPNQRAISAYMQVLNELRNMRATEDNARIKFSPEAYECRMEFMRTAAALANAEGIPGTMAAHIRKFEAKFPRLCLLFHLVDLAVQGRHPNGSESISRETAEKVRDLMIWEYGHIEEFWLETLGDGGDSFAQKIAGHILAHNITTLYHNKHVAEPYFKQWKALSDRERLNAYSTLEAAGWIMRLNDAKQNVDRVWSKWQVNPEVHKKFTRQAADERQRRAEFREKREADLARRAAQSDDC